MKGTRKTIQIVLALLIIASALIAPPLVHAFQEGWESSSTGTYVPTSHDNLPLPLIAADEGDWLLGDTVSEFPECGSTPHTAEILASGGNKSLRLTSNDSSSSCADNVWVNLFEVPTLGLNPGFSIPLTSGTIISFEETGNLISPETGSPYCVTPPCGDTVSLTLEDNRGNMLAYVLQRAPDAVPNEVRSFYREVFLDPDAGAYSRDLFEDFKTIPDFNPSGATIRTVAFEVSEHGTATIDNICIGTSGCVPPLPANFSADPRSGVAPLSVNFTDESTGTITSWNWNFGDGTSSTIQNPSHTYTNEGHYDVSLTVSGPYGSYTETKTDYISVGADVDIWEDDFNDGIIDRIFWRLEEGGDVNAEETSGYVEISAPPLKPSGHADLISNLVLDGDFDVWLDYDWVYLDGAPGARWSLHVVSSDGTEEVILNNHRWNLGNFREIILHKRVDETTTNVTWVSANSVPLSGSLRIQRVGATINGYYRESGGNWILLGETDLYADKVHAYFRGSNSPYDPASSFTVHLDNFHAEANWIIFPEPKPMPWIPLLLLGD